MKLLYRTFVAISMHVWSIQTISPVGASRIRNSPERSRGYRGNFDPPPSASEAAIQAYLLPRPNYVWFHYAAPAPSGAIGSAFYRDT
jgi:hypothetical protein